MITQWRQVPSPDGVKPVSWRIRLRVFLCVPGKEPGLDTVDTILDTGSPWSVLTEDLAADYCGIKDIEKGTGSSVSWLGSEMPAWQHRVKLVVPHSRNPKVTTTLDDFPILFVHSYVRPGASRPLSMAVLGADFCRHVLSILDGPEAKLIM